MSKIFNSASKVVFVMTALSVCIGFFLNKFSEENFKLLVGVVFTYYFTRDKGDGVSTITTIDPNSSATINNVSTTRTVTNLD